MKPNRFTLSDAFAVQAEQLTIWKTKLTPECFNALAIHVRDSNNVLLNQDSPNPYHVLRGQSLSEFVHNWRPTKPIDFLAAMREVESAHFRTVSDTGANSHALTVWNALRRHVGLPYISKDDLPAWDGKAYVMPAGSNLLTAKE